MLFTAAIIAYRSLPELGSLTTILIRIVAVPIGTGLFYLALASGGGASLIGPGDAIAAAASVGSISSAVATSMLIAHDRFESTLPYIAIASHGRIAAWSGRLGLVMAVGVIAAIVTAVVLLGIVATPLPLDTWASLVLVIVVSSSGAIGLGFLLGAISLKLGDSLLLANIAEYALPLLCGAVAPLSVFPEPIRAVLQWLPPAGAIQAGRALSRYSAGPQFWSSIGPGIVGGALALLVGVAVWHYLEHQARRDASIESLNI